MTTFFFKTFFLSLFFTPVLAIGEVKEILRENIAKANKGDFIVTNQGKMFTVLHVRGATETGFVLEEINAPVNRIPKKQYTWREWVENEAPGHTSWVVYWLNTGTGEIERAFSFTKKCWFKIKDSENFLTTLLNLPFRLVPPSERKKVGPKSVMNRQFWQPKMIVDGKTIPNVKFDAWWSRWPNDSSELSGKSIEVFIPEEGGNYPSYFPYWLQIRGIIGKARIRIVDSGSNLKSPKPL